MKLYVLFIWILLACEVNRIKQYSLLLESLIGKIITLLCNCFSVHYSISDLRFSTHCYMTLPTWTAHNVSNAHFSSQNGSPIWTWKSSKYKPFCSTPSKPYVYLYPKNMFWYVKGTQFRSPLHQHSVRNIHQVMK